MSTHKRLNEVLESAQEITFNVSSRFILFSDCHRGDNSWSDDFAHNEKLFFHALSYYYNEGFTYIEIGDGDELWENKKFKEIRLTHSHIFWLLQKFHDENRFYLIWGNHNKLLKNREYVEKNLYRYFNERNNCYEPLFEGINVHEGLLLQDANSKKRIFLFHGHQGDLMCDYLWSLSMFLVRHIWKPLQLFGVKDPTSPAKNYKKRIKVERKIIDWVKSTKETVICGHTHRPVFPVDGKASYFNTGSCVHPRCITGIEIVKEKIALIKWSVSVKKDGTLFVGREVLSGPNNLQNYF